MTQMPTTPGVSTQKQFWQNWPRARILVSIGLLVGALICAGCAASGLQPWLAFALCIVSGSASILHMLQTLRQEQQAHHTALTTLTGICQSVLDGEITQRAQLAEMGLPVETQLIVKTLNQLLDSYSYLHEDAQARRQELAQLYDQMELLLYEMQPVATGDLRARSSVTGNTLGKIAALCNALVEDTAQLVQWAQYMSDQIIQTSHGLMDHLLEITQRTETFAIQQEETTSTIEMLLAFALQMESALYSNIELLREYSTYLRDSGETPELQRAQSPASMVFEPFQNRERQAQLLEHILQKTRETTSLAENAIQELQNVARRFRHVNGVVVQLASMINSLTTLADNWRQAAENYALPTPTGAHMRIVETVSVSLP